ncbi:hypothetical protein PGB90_003273 [Kerria lacca]
MNETAEILKEIKSLSQKFEIMNQNFRALSQKFEKVKNSIKELKTTVGKLSNDFDELKQEQNEIQEEFDAMGKDLHSTNRRLNDLEQHSRKHNIIINGVPESKDENVYEIIEKIGTTLEEPLEKNDIAIAHRISSRRGTAPIIVRFNNWQKKKDDSNTKIKNSTTYERKNQLKSYATYLYRRPPNKLFENVTRGSKKLEKRKESTICML